MLSKTQIDRAIAGVNNIVWAAAVCPAWCEEQKSRGWDVSKLIETEGWYLIPQSKTINLQIVYGNKHDGGLHLSNSDPRSPLPKFRDDLLAELQQASEKAKH